MVSLCCEIFLLCFVLTVLTFFIAGLLYLLCFEHVDNLGAYSIPSETGLLIPSDFVDWGMAGPRNVEEERAREPCRARPENQGQPGVFSFFPKDLFFQIRSELVDDFVNHAEWNGHRDPRECFTHVPIFLRIVGV